MFWNAKNGSVRTDDTEMNYVTFGIGKEYLVMITGLGDTAYGKVNVINP